MEIVFRGLTRQRSRAWNSEQAGESKAGRAERAGRGYLRHRKNRVFKQSNEPGRQFLRVRS